MKAKLAAVFLLLNVLAVVFAVTFTVMEAHRIRAALGSVPEVNLVVSKVGRPDDGTDPKIFNGGEFFVELKPESTWRPGYDKPRIMAQMNQAVAALGIDSSFSQPIRHSLFGCCSAAYFPLQHAGLPFFLPIFGHASSSDLAAQRSCSPFFGSFYFRFFFAHAAPVAGAAPDRACHPSRRTAAHNRPHAAQVPVH